MQPAADTIDTLFRLISGIKDPGQRLSALADYPRPSLCRFATARAVREAARAFAGIPFQELHVFRMYLAPFAEPYLRAEPDRRPICRLDLDDWDSRTRGRLAGLLAAVQDPAAAAQERWESGRYATMEREYLPCFDHVYVCSRDDQRGMRRDYGCRNTVVIPNAIRVPPLRPRRRTAEAFTFLFVGSLGYYPNEDAATTIRRARVRVREDPPQRRAGPGPAEDEPSSEVGAPRFGSCAARGPRRSAKAGCHPCLHGHGRRPGANAST